MGIFSKLGISFTVEISEPKQDSANTSLKADITFNEPAHPARADRNMAQAIQIPTMHILGGEFAIVDIETTGLSAKRDAIIEIAAVTVAPDMQVASEFVTLVKTETRIPHHIVEMTGITQVHLDEQGMPLDYAMKGFLAHIASRPLFAHNASFDIGFLVHAANQLGLALDNPVYDTLSLARKLWPGLPSYKLGVLAQLLNLGHQPTHRALDDVKATLELLRAAVGTLNGARSCNTSVTAMHASSHHSIARKGDANGLLHGESIVFTGELSMTREQAAELAAAAGCNVTSGVTKKTTVLVIGTQDISTLAGHEKSSKHRKAEALIANGQAIRILTETDFLAMVAHNG